jgi:hypothetical protein
MNWIHVDLHSRQLRKSLESVLPHTALQSVATAGLNESNMGFTQAEESQFEEESVWPSLRAR